MARVIGRSKIRENVGPGLRLPEIIVFIIIIAAVVMGVRYYFFVYRTSPSFALGEYLAAIKSGKVDQQYDLLDGSDKKKWSLKEYEEQAPQAHGYTARIADVKMDDPKIDPKKPNIATVDVTVTIRKQSEGQALYQQSSDDYKDNFTMKQDSEGKWRVLISRWQRGILKAPPSPPGS